MLEKDSRIVIMNEVLSGTKVSFVLNSCDDTHTIELF